MARVLERAGHDSLSGDDVNDIKVGDLVYVYRWPCCGAYLGMIYRVAGVEILPSHYGNWECRHCGGDLGRSSHFFGEHHGRGLVGRDGAPLDYLKKIPPLGDLQGEHDRVPLRQPVTVRG